MTDYTPVWKWMMKREAARIQKDNNIVPSYNDDSIISAYRFCNVRREDDRGTIWIRENIRKPFAGHHYLWFMLCIARQINWPETLHELINEGRSWPNHPEFCPTNMTSVLQSRKALGNKVYTGAYMISAPATKGANKQAYISEMVCGDLWKRREEIQPFLTKDPSLKGIHSLLMGSKGWGQFMAYQAVVDMRFTSILENAYDVQTWAAAGPGTLRGLNRIHGRELKYPLSQVKALDEMRKLYQTLTLVTGIELDFSDVPNVLCETDKYLRVLNNEGRPRAKYIPGRGY